MRRFLSYRFLQFLLIGSALVLFLAACDNPAGSDSIGGGGGPAFGDGRVVAPFLSSSITYGDGLFVAVGASDQVMTSADGINWTEQQGGGDSDVDWVSVAYGGGRFVAVGSGFINANRVMTSTDGENWTAGPAPNITLNSIAYGNDKFVAVSGRGTSTVMTSPNGVDWTSQDAAENLELWGSVTYGDGLFVVVGVVNDENPNGVMTSPDGINWTAREAAEQDGWLSVTYGDGMFVALGRDGGLMTSPNGIEWTAREAVGQTRWRSVTHGGGLFVAVGSDSIQHFGSEQAQVMTSTDGITWTGKDRAASETLFDWTSVTYGDGKFVAVGWYDFDDAVMYAELNP